MEELAQSEKISDESPKRKGGNRRLSKSVGLKELVASVVRNLKNAAKLVVWESINPVLLGLTRSRRCRWDPNCVGINLGCGMNNEANWLGIDGGVYVLLQKVPRPILAMIYYVTTMKKDYSRHEYVERIRNARVLHHELGYGIPFDDDSVPAVFSSHFFEHLSREDADKLLLECFRVMKPGGIIRIVVPSLDTQVAKIRQAIARYDAGEIEDIQPFVTTDIVGYSNKYSNHRWMYNFQEMQIALAAAGFVETTEQSYRSGRIRDVETLDNRGGLVVEAVKPRGILSSHN